jgi:hypothetical protein
MRILDIPKSGRCGKFVFYMRGRRLCRRLYVVPRDVRTAARRRTRGAFGAISKAWSQVLTEEQRQAWIVAGAKVESHPRLWQSGPLTGEMHFEGINSARCRIGANMLLWPTERAVFSPMPIEGLAISYVNGQIRLRLKVSGPVAEDIMVFGLAPCGARRKKWRHGAYLDLLPAPEGGESDITDIYVRRYGEPKPGKKVFIRIQQQRNGWEGNEKDLSEVVPAKPVVAARPGGVQIRSPKAEILTPSADWSRGLPSWPGRLSQTVSTPGRPRILFASPATPVRCAMHKGVVPEQYRSTSQVTPVQSRRGTGCPRGVRAFGPGSRCCPPAEVRWKGHWRELWHGS